MRDAPRYGTVGPEQIPVETIDRNGSFARVVAGRYRLKRGPARFAVNVQILDIELKPDTEFLYERPPNMDNVMFYCLDGGGRLNGANTLYQRQICRFDTTTGKVKVSVSASSGGMRFMVFAGVALREPLTWHGPFVCADRGQLEEVFRQHQAGAFPPVRDLDRGSMVRRAPAASALGYASASEIVFEPLLAPRGGVQPGRRADAICSARGPVRGRASE